MRCSNNLLGILNFLTLLLSLPILSSGIWLSHRAHTDCESYLQTPIIALGAFLLLTSLLGLIGSCCKVNWLLWLYLLIMFLLILILFCFTIFAFVVTNPGAGEKVSGRGYKEYRLGDYSNWLQKRVSSNKNWNKIKTCLADGKVCQSLEKESQTSDVQFFAKHLNPLQSGCCKPSDSCNFQYVSPTVWTKNGTATNPDCNAWSNDPKVLCFNCQSCKAGVLQNLKGDWKKVAVVNIIVLIFLIVVYSVGCCAFRNNRWDNASRWKPYG